MSARTKQAAAPAPTESEGLTLTAAQVEQLTRALDHLHTGLRAAHELALDATAAPETSDQYMTAIESIAVLGCLRCDFMLALLGEPAIGNFQDEVLTEAQSESMRSGLRPAA